MEHSKLYFMDIETSALNPREGEIKLIAHAIDTESIVASYWVNKDMERKLSDPDFGKVFHNAKFDVGFFKACGYDVCNYHCTMLMAQVLGEEQVSLKALVKKHLGIDMDKSMQHSDNWQGGILTSDHIEYVKKDVEYTRMLFYKLHQMLVDKQLLETYERERQALPAIVMLESNGIKMKFNEWNELLDEDRRLCKELETQIQAMLINTELNLNSPKQLVEAIYEKYGIKLHSTSDDELARYVDTNETIKLIRKYRKLQTKIKTYGQKLKEFIQDDGRIRANWRLIGATSGRMACSKPPLQGMPGKSREFFVAEEGYKIVCSDYSQIELRVLSEISQDETLIGYFRNNVDLHSGTASLIFQKSLSDVTKEERQVAKSLNFGIVYGITAYGIQRSLRKSGVDVSLDEAEQYRLEFLKAYPKVKELQDALLRANEIKTLGGRRWQGSSLSMTQRMNLPIQGSAAEGLKEALALLIKQMKSSWRLVAVVHDEVVLEVPQLEVELAKQVLEDCMVQGMGKFVNSVPVIVETAINDSWCK